MCYILLLPDFRSLLIGAGIVALCNRADHYIFILFLLLLRLLFISSPNPSGRRLDVYHTSAHGLSANLECRSEMRCMRLVANTGRKNRHLGTIAQLCRAISSQLRHVSTIGEKSLLSSNTSSTCPDNMVNFGPLTGEIGSGVWAPLQISTGFASRQRYCITASSSGRQPNFAALNRGRHLCSAGRPSRWALAHILVLSC